MQNLRRGAETKIMVSAEIIPIEPYAVIREREYFLF